MGEQQRQMEEQQRQIRALQTALEDQKKLIGKVTAAEATAPSPVPEHTAAKVKDAGMGLRAFRGCCRILPPRHFGSRWIIE